MKKACLAVAVSLFLMGGVWCVFAVPLLINYQGMVDTGGDAFSGTGLFRFAIVNVDGTVQYWSNDGENPPVSGVAITVTDGLFNVILGDLNLMDPLVASIFDHDGIYLRVWFNDGINGWQQLNPDQEITSVGFAFKASDADSVGGHVYSADWPTTLNNVRTALSHDFHNVGGIDDDSPDSDSEVPDDISVDNGSLYAPAGSANVGVGTASPSEKLEVAGKAKLRDGLEIGAAPHDGVVVDSAGSVTEAVSSSDNNGVEIQGAEGNGVYVGSTGEDGVFVNHAHLKGLSVGFSDDDGLYLFDVGNASDYFISTDKNGVEICGVDGNGLFVGRATGDGLHIFKVGDPSDSASNIGKNGVEIEGTDGHGLFIGHSDWDAIRIDSTDENGVTIEAAALDGIEINATGNYGVIINSTSSDGFHITEAGIPTHWYTSATSDGMEISGAEGYGIYIGWANLDAVHVSSSAAKGFYVYNAGSPSDSVVSSSCNGFDVAGASGNGVYVGRSDKSGVVVNSAGDSGVYINQSEKDGILIVRAGAQSNITYSNLHNGFEVAGAAGYGLFAGTTGNDGIRIENSGMDGVQVTESGDDGIYVSSTNDDGVQITNAGGDGLYVHNTGNYGLFVESATSDGIHVNTLDASHEWGVYTPDKIYAGTSLSTGYITSFGLNVGNESLEPGDVVCLAGGYMQNIPDPGSAPIPKVVKADAAHSEAVIGVVESAVQLHVNATEEREKGLGTSLRKSFHSKQGAAGNNDYVSIIILGSANVKVDPNVKQIEPGGKLTVSETSGTARCVSSRDDVWHTGIIGKAMEQYNQSGKIKVFVNCR